MADLKPEQTAALAHGLCMDDDSWAHHDQTDAEPCSSCRAKADHLAPTVTALFHTWLTSLASDTDLMFHAGAIEHEVQDPVSDRLRGALTSMATTSTLALAAAVREVASRG